MSGTKASHLMASNLSAGSGVCLTASMDVVSEGGCSGRDRILTILSSLNRRATLSILNPNSTTLRESVCEARTISKFELFLYGIYNTLLRQAHLLYDDSIKYKMLEND